mmetsp:Transcript_78617/g.222253  ORF Transcript_78617/g.222253 Transcript_78617/m.222253 type:complete len:225 (-) Transcript_78617:952-1626(-)
MRRDAAADLAPPLGLGGRIGLPAAPGPRAGCRAAAGDGQGQQGPAAPGGPEAPAARAAAPAPHRDGPRAERARGTSKPPVPATGRGGAPAGGAQAQCHARGCAYLPGNRLGCGSVRTPHPHLPDARGRRRSRTDCTGRAARDLAGAARGRGRRFRQWQPHERHRVWRGGSRGRHRDQCEPTGPGGLLAGSLAAGPLLGGQAGCSEAPEVGHPRLHRPPGRHRRL